MNKNSIVLTGGGTAGHCIPCLSLLPELEKSFDKIYYVGSENGVEKKLATDAGLTYFSVPCVKLVRKLTLKNLAVPFTLAKGVTEAKKLLEKIRPDVVFSKGGYVALPVCLAAEKLKIPTVLHESDLSLGLANRLARKKATLLLTGFGQTAENYPRAVFTGNPLRRELLQKRDRRAIIDKYGFKEQKPVLLVIGGSQGAGKINDALRNSLDKLLENFCILHIAGKNKTSGIKRDGYYETEYVSDMGAAFATADVCVSRAGANALAELVALKIPTLAVPLPKGNSRGDQEENAAYYARRGAIRVLEEKNLTTDTFIKEIFSTYAQKDSLKKACAKTGIVDANETIADRILSVINRD